MRQPLTPPRMPADPPALPPSAKRIAPSAALSDCVRTYIARDTTVLPPLPPAQRLNRFPATVHCCIVWFLEGSAEMLQPAPADAPPPWSPAWFSGPQSRPTVSRNPGPVRLFIAMFYPQALHVLAGLDISHQLDRLSPLHEVLDTPWQAMSAQVLAAPDDEGRIAAIEAFLQPRWQAALDGGTAISPTEDWLDALAAHAARSGRGLSERSLERHVKAWAGQPLRTLRRLSRAEQAYLDARRGPADGRFSWADMAARTGFADQAHLCRETRQVTGHTPAELAQRVADDESYWLYRVWS